jgi:hypothetical protein
VPIDLEALLTFAEYQERRSRQFPSLESFRWYTRLHSVELIKAEALLLIAGRKFINPAACDKVVAANGLKLARERAEA